MVHEGRVEPSAYLAIEGDATVASYPVHTDLMPGDAVEAWVRLRHTSGSFWEKLPFTKRFVPTEDLVVIAGTVPR